MIKLYGFTLSNYFNMVKMALLEKAVPFEFVDTRPSQDAEFLAMSPMGKVPCIETEQGFLSESDVIMDYLEAAYPEPALFPKDPFERAKVQELIKELELYIELPARTCFPETFFGGKVSDEVKEKAHANLLKGAECLKRNGKFKPYLAGSEFTAADIFFMHSVSLAGSVSRKLFDFDLLASVPGAGELYSNLKTRESAKQVAADQKA